ncbi:RNA polymerase sigma factor [Sporosarcina beigongshangi]|uniref:RNA polymerase sigma factor n=1 Tax=Sporosarcina beigongshangi TaxID=2782538 RepID=UPI00193AD9B7|nr:sigma-70 family RNA polymerase sigma factor [Sporosarcina beigongshangi]
MTDHRIEEWFQLYERDITSFLIYYTGSMDVEDLVQETFMIAIKKIPGFKDQSHPKTWLVSIARNKIIDDYRRKKVWEKIKHSVFREQQLSNELEEKTIMNQEILHLYKAIHQLSPRYKEVVILRGILELTSKEASEVLKSNVNRVNVMFHRALKRLKEILVEEGLDYEGHEDFTRKSKKPS